MALNALVDLFCHNQKKCESKRVKGVELQWLPIAHRIKFKIALLMFMVHYGCSSAYTSVAETPAFDISSAAPILLHRRLHERLFLINLVQLFGTLSASTISEITYNVSS